MILLHVSNGRVPFKACGFSHTKKAWKFSWIKDSKMIVLLESFQKFYGNYFFFEMLAMDRCSKNSNNLFYKTPMDASG